MRDCQSVCAESPISGFTLKRFEAAGVSDVAMRAARGEPLSPGEGERLADVSLPLLAKLLSLRPNRARCGSPGVDPALYLPLSKRTDSKTDSASAIAKAAATVRDVAAQLAELIERDERVCEFGNSVRSLHVLMGNNDRSVQDRLVPAVAEISDDIGGIRVSLSPQWERDTLPRLPDGIARSIENDDRTDESQASNTLRAIAIASLTADRSEIRAPIGLLGIKTAHVALCFGANHLGQVAVNDATAKALNIPTLVELADALRYDGATPT